MRAARFRPGDDEWVDAPNITGYQGEARVASGGEHDIVALPDVRPVLPCMQADNVAFRLMTANLAGDLGRELLVEQ
jgi:hypothetical protein